jgi:hypothetical protein
VSFIHIIVLPHLLHLKVSLVIFLSSFIICHLNHPMVFLYLVLYFSISYNNICNRDIRNLGLTSVFLESSSCGILDMLVLFDFTFYRNCFAISTLVYFNTMPYPNFK